MLEIIHNSLAKIGRDSLFYNVNMSANKTVTQEIQSISLYCVQASWTGWNNDATALITVSASNDQIIWTIVSEVTPTSTVGDYMLNVEKAGYRYVQIKFTQTTGSGILNITISGKVI